MLFHRQFAVAIVLSCLCLWQPRATAQVTLECEWTGSSLGTWFDPTDPTQIEIDFDIVPDWSCDGGIEIGGITYNTVNYPNNLPGFNFNVTANNVLITVPPIVPIRISNIEFGGLASGVSIEAGGSWGIVSGTATGGSISVNALGIDSVFSDLTVNGTATFTGGGSILMGDSVGTRVTGGVATTFSNTLVLDDYTLSGAGQLGNESMSLRVLQNGIVRANGTNDLVIDPGQNNNVMNLGLIEAVDGAALKIRQTAIVNADGTIRANNGSLVEFFDVALSGGSLEGSGLIRGTGTVRLENQITNNSAYAVSSGSLTILDGTLINNNQVTIGGGTFSFQSDTTLTGGGSFVLGVGNGTSLFGGTGTTAEVTNADNTIRGGGNIGFIDFVNQGEVIADESAAALRILAADVDNDGNMSATNGGELNIRSGAFDNADGMVFANNGTVSVTNGGQVSGGTVNLDGSSVLRLDNGAIVGGAYINNTSGGTIETGILGGSINGNVVNPDGGTIRVANDSRLTLFGSGSYLNSGMIDIDGEGPFSSFGATGIELNGEVTIEGGGQIDLGESGDAVLLSTAGTFSKLINVDNRIFGAGHIGFNVTEVVNHGTIEANTGPTEDAGSGYIYLDPGSGGFTNTGIIRARSGGKLSIRNGAYENAGGVIETLSGSSIEIEQGASIRQGTLRSSGNGFAQVDAFNVMFDEMNIDAQVNVGSTGQLRLRSDTINRKTIHLDGAAQMLIDGEVRLTGGGTVHLEGAMTRIFSLADGIDDVLINVNNTIKGTGRIQFLDIVNSGTVAPGNSPGTLTLGDFTQTDTGILDIELQGINEFDILEVLGNAELGGTLRVSLLPGLDIAAGSSFEFLNANSISGNFDQFVLPTGNSGQQLFSVESSANSFQLIALEDIVFVPEPNSMAVSIFAFLIVSGQRRRNVTSDVV